MQRQLLRLGREDKMKKIAEVTYKKVGNDGYCAHIEYSKEGEIGGHAEEEFFSEDWKTLIDRVLFFLVELVE